MRFLRLGLEWVQIDLQIDPQIDLQIDPQTGPQMTLRPVPRWPSDAHILDLRIPMVQNRLFLTVY